MTGLLVVANGADALAGLVATFVQLLSALVVIYVLLDLARSFVGDLPAPVIAIHDALGKLCEPLFAPIRSVLPPLGGIDFSPLITLILISVIGQFVVSLLQ